MPSCGTCRSHRRRNRPANGLHGQRRQRADRRRASVVFLHHDVVRPEHNDCPGTGARPGRIPPTELAQVSSSSGSIVIEVARSMNADQQVSVDYATIERHGQSRHELCCDERNAHVRSRAVLRPDRRADPRRATRKTPVERFRSHFIRRREQRSGRSARSRSRSRALLRTGSATRSGSEVRSRHHPSEHRRARWMSPSFFQPTGRRPVHQTRRARNAIGRLSVDVQRAARRRLSHDSRQLHRTRVPPPRPKNGRRSPFPSEQATTPNSRHGQPDPDWQASVSAGRPFGPQRLAPNGITNPSGAFLWSGTHDVHDPATGERHRA